MSKTKFGGLLKLSSWVVVISIIFTAMLPQQTALAIIEGLKADGKLDDGFWSVVSVRFQRSYHGSTIEEFKGKREKSRCTGILVAKKFVVTAAHCFTFVVGNGPIFAAPPEVTIEGAAHFVQDGQRVQIRNVILHPSYTMAHNQPRYDIAVARLAHEPSPPVKSVKILGPEWKGRTIKVTGRIFGFGEFELPDRTPEDVLRFANVEVSILPQWLELYVLGAGGCRGDSGGPLFFYEAGEAYLAGIISRGDTACAQGTGFTYIPPILDWVVRATTDETPNLPSVISAPVQQAFGSWKIKKDVSEGAANVRRGPGLDQAITGFIPAGTGDVKATGACVPLVDGGRSKKPWCPIKWEKLDGWISSTNLESADNHERVESSAGCGVTYFCR